MSNGSVPSLPLDIGQIVIDINLNPIILQAFITGVYTWLFFPTLVSLIRQRQISLFVVLNALYICIIFNLSSGWFILRRAVVNNAGTRAAMVSAFMSDPMDIVMMGNTTLYIPILLADCLLAWRCSILWRKDMRIIIMFSALVLAECGILLASLVLPSIALLGPRKVTMLVIVYFLSAAITTIATTLIIYRILSMSRSMNNLKSRPTTYQFTIEILIESGMLYTTVILLCGILIAVGPGITWQRLHVGQVMSYFLSILVPVTGIAPTLITARIVASHARTDRELENPVSNLIFNFTAEFSVSPDAHAELFVSTD